MPKQKKQTPVLRLSRPAMVTICLLLIGATLLAQVFARPEHTQAATNETINFQARLLTAAGSVVPDGNYNVEFKLYAAASGGSALWTETRTTTNRVRVVNGYLTVNLGSVTSFPSSIDWDQELWMTMNIGGITESPDWDGEMTPRLKLTSVPFAKRAGELAGGTGSNRTILDVGTPSGNNLLHLPAESGTLCVQLSSQCGFMTTAGGVHLQPSTPGSQQTGHFNISGTGIIGTALTTPIVDSSGSLSLGTTNATSVSLGRSASSTTITGSSVTLAGNTSVTGGSTFRVQNAGGNELFLVDGTQVVLGKASTVSGKMVFQNATNTNTAAIQSGTTSSSYTLTLPTALGAAGNCLKDTNGSGALGFGACAGDLQTAYNGSTSPEIVLNSTNGALTIRDASSPVGALLEVQNNAGSTTYFRADTSGITVTGNVNAGTGTHVGSAFQSTAQTGASTNSAAVSLGSGQVSGATSNSGAVTLQSGASTTSGDTGSVTIKSGNATSGDSGDVSIDVGTASGTAGVINIGTATASAITLGNATNSIETTINGSVLIKSATAQDLTNAFDVQKANGDSILKIDTIDGLVVIGDDTDLTGARAKLAIGDTCGTEGINCISIFEGPEFGTTTFDDTDIMQLQGAGGFRFSTSTSRTSRVVIDSAGNVGIGTENPSEDLTVVGNFNIQNTGTITKQYRFRTTGSALDVESSGTDLYISGWTGADYTGTQHVWARGNLSLPALFVGDGIARDAPMKLVLGERATSGDPGGYKGAMYYNSNTSRFRCYEGTEWKDCVSLVEAKGTANAGGIGGTSSATYVNMAGTSSLAFTKKAAATKLVISVDTSLFANGASTSVRIGVNIDGTDYDCTNFFFNELGVHHQVSCTIVVSGVSAGAKTLQARWKRMSGTGGLQTDTGDWTNLTVIETN